MDINCLKQGTQQYSIHHWYSTFGHTRNLKEGNAFVENVNKEFKVHINPFLILHICDV